MSRVPHFEIPPAPPALLIEFPLEQRPHAVNAADLSEADLLRIVDWLVAKNVGLKLDDWLDRHLSQRGVAA